MRNVRQPYISHCYIPSNMFEHKHVPEIEAKRAVYSFSEPSTLWMRTRTRIQGPRSDGITEGS